MPYVYSLSGATNLILSGCNRIGKPYKLTRLSLFEFLAELRAASLMLTINDVNFDIKINQTGTGWLMIIL